MAKHTSVMRSTRIARISVAVTALLFASAGQAQDCVGFSDVAASDTFCPSVEWIKNRRVTLGCGAGIFCPSAVVYRNQMAAFMQRLGAALTPVPTRVQSIGFSAIVDTNPVVCAMPADIASATYARTAVGTFFISGQVAAGFGIEAKLVASSNGGTTWIDVPGVVPMRVQGDNGTWIHVTGDGMLDLDIGSTWRLGVRLSKVAGAGNGNNLQIANCELSALVLNRNPAASPL